MMKVSILFLVILSVVFATNLSDKAEWEQFKELKRVNHKSYGSAEEEERRFEIFQDNLKKIREHNKLYDEGKTTWKMGVNQFSDLTLEEFQERFGHGIDLKHSKK